ncbi:hypothetical protein FG385_19690 [Amycolatopsis alkalitolerans]|uniref:Uncharacterized protein n=2 Tax=Amycolatopsis alkalitolerans TaxID=2547244 RepID=A0A5C4LXC5_9PSEU|nr:hypothetical protein FG385_19690 [Amycolatopsis alkalitolerans]
MTHPGLQSRAVPARRIITLAGQLSDELSDFDTHELCAAELRGLLRGMTGTASALTRILDQLRECAMLSRLEHEVGLPAYQTVRSELEQAAAAAEDLRVTAESLCGLLPLDVSVPARRGG